MNSSAPPRDDGTDTGRGGGKLGEAVEAGVVREVEARSLRVSGQCGRAVFSGAAIKMRHSHPD